MSRSVAAAIWMWLAISCPWSQVRVRRRVCGSLDIAIVIASWTSRALWVCGKCNSMTNPEAIRRIGATRLSAWLKKRGCRGSANVARKAVDAANAQHTVLRTEAVGSQLVAQLAEQIGVIDTEIAQLDTQISERFDQHRDAPILLSMPGFGPVLAATFLANTGGDLNTFETVDRLASVAGLAPAPRDSGRISGNHHRPKRFNRRLMRTCYLAALSSLKNSTASRAFYERKRAEGKSHKQALIALARRRITTIWAMLRDRTTYQEPPPPALASAA
jgi:hypothetical protein